jgi:tetratricopeptide (TPR) repeat protein
MQLTIKSLLKRKLTVVGAYLFLVLIILASVRELVADKLADYGSLSTLKAATRIVPENADYHFKLARYYDLIARDQPAALWQYQQAVRWNPHDSRSWIGLADIYGASGDVDRQSAAIHGAVTQAPTNPEVAWVAANLNVSQGLNDDALRQFHIVLLSGSDNSPFAMQMAWRINPDVDSLLRDVIPANRDSYVAFLVFLMSKQDTEGSLKVWDALVGLQQPIESNRAFDYVRYLLAQKAADDAPAVWRQATPLIGAGGYLPSSNNLIVNPNFNMDVLNGGFDWQYRKQSSVSLQLDTNERHDGHRSLAITFDGPGVSDAGIFQVIAVQPNTTYQFSGFYKNGEIDGAGGPVMALQDLYSGQTCFQSKELKDSPDWNGVVGELTTGPDAKILVLRVRRIPDGSPIRGKLWIADFRLAEKTADTATP